MPNRFQGLHLLIDCSIVNMLAGIPFTPAPTISSDHVGNFPYTTAVPTLTNERWILLELFSTRSHLQHRKNSMERLLNAVLLGDKTFPSETEHTCLPTPDREPWQTKVWILLGLLIGVWVKTYRSRNDSGTVVSPKPTPVWVIAEAHCTASRQLNRLESSLLKWLCHSKPH